MKLQKGPFFCTSVYKGAIDLAKAGSSFFGLAFVTFYFSELSERYLTDLQCSAVQVTDL